MPNFINVPFAVIQRRRKRNKAARLSRRINRGNK